MNDKVTYWIEMSDYDFDTAKAMLETKRYLYVALDLRKIAVWIKTCQKNRLTS